MQNSGSDFYNTLLNTKDRMHNIDGSKSENIVVFAVVSKTNFAFGSPSLAASIFSAVLHAILTSVKITKDLRNHYIVINCNSQCFANNQVLKLIPPSVKGSSRLACTGSSRWVPAHVGVSGSEQADRRAKTAVAHPCDARFPLPHSNLKPRIRNCLRDKWRELWRHTSRKQIVGD